MKASFIGCGNIASFHADALKFYGVEIDSVSYNSNELKAAGFQKKYNVNTVYDNWEKMLESGGYDMIWVLAAWDKIDAIFEKVIKFNKPVFFEKPLALSSERIGYVINSNPDFNFNQIQIGYNRRFYDIVLDLKKRISDEKVIAVNVELPEPVSIADEMLKKYRLIQNSSHLFDLLFFLFGQKVYSIEYIKKLGRDNKTGDFTASLKIGSTPVSIFSVWNAPQNYSIKIYTEEDRVYQLNPVEKLAVYKGFDIAEPGEGRPIREYRPKVEFEKYVKIENGLKPGFKEQTDEFLNKAYKGLASGIASNIYDAKLVTGFCEEIMNA